MVTTEGLNAITWKDTDSFTKNMVLSFYCFPYQQKIMTEISENIYE